MNFQYLKLIFFVNDELCKYINSTRVTNIISEENKNLGFEYRKKWNYFLKSNSYRWNKRVSFERQWITHKYCTLF